MKRELELLGLEADDVPIMGGVWKKPGSCQVEGSEGEERLVWTTDGIDGVSVVGPDVNLALKFASLTAGSLNEIRRFGEKYGPLNLCHHGLPRTHLPSRLSRYYREDEFDGHRANAWMQLNRFGEAVSSWRTISGSAAAIMHLVAVAQSKDGLSAKEEWEGLTWLLPDMRPVNGWRFGHFHGSISPTGRATSPGFRPGRARVEANQVLAFSIRRWLELADVSFAVTYRDDRPQLELLAGSLFGAVGVQLALIATQSRGWEMCANCGRAFVPEKRRTPSGKRSYCQDEACRRAVWRDAKADSRRRAAGHTFDTDGLDGRNRRRNEPSTWSPERESNPRPFHYE